MYGIRSRYGADARLTDNWSLAYSYISTHALRVHFFNFVYDNGHFAHYVSLKDPMADMVVLGPFWTFTAQVRVKQARETRF